MKTLKNLRGFTAVRHEKEERRHQKSLVFIEVDRASQDMVDLRDCYDRLSSVAAETANNAYEFAESLGQMGDCLLEKTALNDDEESGKVLLMLGKVQLELQKIVDGYRSNIFKTITIPSDSILNELCIVEMDNVDTSSHPSTKLGAAKENLERSTGQNSFGFLRETMIISQSAPIFREKKLDPAGRSRQMLPSPSHRFTSYVLPTPVEAKSLGSGKADFEDPKHKQVSHNLWHSSPLDQNKHERVVENEKSSGSILLDAQQVLTESNNNTKSSRLPPSLLDGFSSKQFDPNVAFDTRKVKRQAFSGPITGKPWPKNPNLSASGHIISSEYPLPFSGSILRTPLPQPMSMPKLLSRVSPTFMSSPIISELHELPRPPAHLPSNRLSNHIAHSGPLVSKGHELPTASISATSVAKSTLPMPPQTIYHSYSISSGGRKESALHEPSEASQNLKMTEAISSPPSTPISLPDVQPAAPPTP
ncbi:unnamed protein product [Fraxinus pennsylvanica]|uniref:Hydroxyproline-rich glycoprotein family protein n=1 Tax=Fraxinus pennsylvanica TaxID=56036 RepID=A0AAD1YTJ7_9LAMI|nr:unnamed protein product [Fraxinus pennsylvanica]